MDSVAYLDLSKTPKDDTSTPIHMNVLLGASDGSLFIYDPMIIEEARILRFNSDEKMPFWKNKRPEQVKWHEPLPNQIPTKFSVAWEDGTIYMYDKNIAYDRKENFKESLI